MEVYGQLKENSRLSADVSTLSLFSSCSCCVNHRSGQPKNGEDLANADTSFDLKPVSHEGLEEQVMGLESEEKEGDLDYERYKIIK